MEANHSTSSPNDWVELFFRHTLSNQGPGQVSSVIDATTITTTAAPTVPTSRGGLNPEGRVSKPPRRRRASRSAPTTLINTDATNFRDMVQQFTGVPNPASLTFGSIGSRSGQNVNANTITQGSQSGMNANANMIPQNNGYAYIHNPYQLQQQQQQQQQQHQQQQQQQQQQHIYMFSPENQNDGSISSFGNTRPNLEATDSYVRGEASFQMFPRSSSARNMNNNRLGEW